jgi:hypothetical protein
MNDCDLYGVIHNITHNCETDIEVIKDNCKILCMMSIIKGIDMCQESFSATGLLDQFKSIIKWCYYERYEIVPDGH